MPDSTTPSPSASESERVILSRLLVGTIEDRDDLFELLGGIPVEDQKRLGLFDKWRAILDRRHGPPVLESAARPAPGTPKEQTVPYEAVLAILRKNSAHIAASPGVGDAKAGYAQATIKDIAGDLAMLVRERERAGKGEPKEPCDYCGGSGVVHTLVDETEVGLSPGSSARPCPDCATPPAAPGDEAVREAKEPDIKERAKKAAMAYFTANIVAVTGLRTDNVKLTIETNPDTMAAALIAFHDAEVLSRFPRPADSREHTMGSYTIAEELTKHATDLHALLPVIPENNKWLIRGICGRLRVIATALCGRAESPAPTQVEVERIARNVQERLEKSGVNPEMAKKAGDSVRETGWWRP